MKERPATNRPILREKKGVTSILRIPESGPLTPRLRDKFHRTEAIGFPLRHIEEDEE